MTRLLHTMVDGPLAGERSDTVLVLASGDPGSAQAVVMDVHPTHPARSRQPSGGSAGVRRPWTRYLRTIALFGVTLWAVITFVLLLPRLMPGDPLQGLENQRDDLVVILAGYRDRMDRFFQSNPGMSSRIAHHVDFPDYAPEELQSIADLMLSGMQYRLSPAASAALADYIVRRREQPNFANARSIRNALDRARLRQASRLMARRGAALTREELMTIEAEDFLLSRVFKPKAENT